MTDRFGVGMDETAAAAAARYREWGDPTDTLRCLTCGHSIWCHYRGVASPGCVATGAPKGSLDQLIANSPRSFPVPGPDGCLCPGFVQGRYPYELRKHCEGLGEGNCSECSHVLDDHCIEYGCLDCPCEVGQEQPALACSSA